MGRKTEHFPRSVCADAPDAAEVGMSGGGNREERRRRYFVGLPRPPGGLLSHPAGPAAVQPLTSPTSRPVQRPFLRASGDVFSLRPCASSFLRRRVRRPYGPCASFPFSLYACASLQSLACETTPLRFSSVCESHAQNGNN